MKKIEVVEVSVDDTPLTIYYLLTQSFHIEYCDEYRRLYKNKKSWVDSNEHKMITEWLVSKGMTLDLNEDSYVILHFN